MLPRFGSRVCRFGLGCLVLVAATVATALPCENYGDHAHWVASVPLGVAGGSARDVVVVGDFAYVANGVPGLFVVDISDPLHPEVRGHVDTPYVAGRLAAAGTLVYVADGNAGLQVVDVADPDAPVLRGRVSSISDAYDVVLAGNYAYVAASGAGVVVVDVTDPDGPLSVRTVDTVGYAYGVCVDGGRLYVADSWNGFLVYDLTDPALPVLLGQYDTAGSANQVAVVGDLAAVADNDGGLVMLDVADPTQIALLEQVATRGYAIDVVLSPAGLAFVAAAGLGIIDVQDPTQCLDLGGIPCGDDAGGIALSGTWAFLADDEAGLSIYDVSVAETAAGLGVTLDTPGYAVGLAAGAGHVFMGSQDSGLQVFDLADPAAPVLVTTLPLPGYPGEVIYRDALAYVSSYSAGLQIVDVADPAAPVVHGSLVTPGNAMEIALVGDLAYVAEEESLRVIDIADPAQPVFLRATVISGDAQVVDASVRGVFVGTLAGELRWFVDSEQGLQFVDEVSLPGACRGVVLQDTTVFATYSAVANSGLVILAASPVAETLTVVATVPLLRSAAGLTFDRGLVYVASGLGGLQIVDVHDPLQPVYLGGTAWPPNDAQAAVVAGEYAYVADLLSGLCTVPRECTEYVAVFLSVFDAALADGAVELAWTAQTDGERAEFRLTADLGGARWDVPFACDGPGIWSARDTSPRLAAGGTVVYTLGYREAGAGWQEIGQQSVALPPSASRLLEPRPNPFNPRTTIPFVIDRAAEATLAVYDQAGREIAVLATGPFAAGAHAAVWDGRDALGRVVPSGVYFARLLTENRIETRKLTLLK
jgi:hypothetical protein